MVARIQIRRDTKAEWESVNTVLGNGEFGLEIETKKLKIGDGVTPWKDLGYIGGEYVHLTGDESIDGVKTFVQLVNAKDLNLTDTNDVVIKNKGVNFIRAAKAGATVISGGGTDKKIFLRPSGDTMTSGQVEIKADGTISGVNFTGISDKATKDSLGNVIKDTYATKTALESIKDTFTTKEYVDTGLAGKLSVDGIALGAVKDRNNKVIDDTYIDKVDTLFTLNSDSTILTNGNVGNIFNSFCTKLKSIQGTDTYAENPPATLKSLNDNKISKNGTLNAFVIEGGTTGTGWYRVWSDGFKEEGGTTLEDTSDSITFKNAFSNVNYTLTVTPYANTELTVTKEGNNTFSITSTSSCVKSWEARGY